MGINRNNEDKKTKLMLIFKGETNNCPGKAYIFLLRVNILRYS